MALKVRHYKPNMFFKLSSITLFFIFGHWLAPKYSGQDIIAHLIILPVIVTILVTSLVPLDDILLLLFIHDNSGTHMYIDINDIN